MTHHTNITGHLVALFQGSDGKDFVAILAKRDITNKGEQTFVWTTDFNNGAREEVLLHNSQAKWAHEIAKNAHQIGNKAVTCPLATMIIKPTDIKNNLIERFTLPSLDPK